MSTEIVKDTDDLKTVRYALETAMDSLLPDRVLGPYFSEAEAALKRVTKELRRCRGEPLSKWEAR